MIGDKQILAFEVLDRLEGSDCLRKMKIWVCGLDVTERDDIAYISSIASCAEFDADKARNLRKFSHYLDGKSVEEAHSFILSLRHPDISFHHGDDLWENHRILDWCSNTDNIVSFLIEKDGVTYITAEFFRVADGSDIELGAVHQAVTSEAEIRDVLKTFSRQISI